MESIIIHYLNSHAKTIMAEGEIHWCTSYSTSRMLAIEKAIAMSTLKILQRIIVENDSQLKVNYIIAKYLYLKKLLY